MARAPSTFRQRDVVELVRAGLATAHAEAGRERFEVARVKISESGAGTLPVPKPMVGRLHSGSENGTGQPRHAARSQGHRAGSGGVSMVNKVQKPARERG